MYAGMGQLPHRLPGQVPSLTTTYVQAAAEGCILPTCEVSLWVDRDRRVCTLQHGDNPEHRTTFSLAPDDPMVVPTLGRIYAEQKAWVEAVHSYMAARQLTATT